MTYRTGRRAPVFSPLQRALLDQPGSFSPRRRGCGAPYRRAFTRIRHESLDAASMVGHAAFASAMVRIVTR